MTSAPTADSQQMANAIRFLAMDAIQVANSGHPGAPMGLADAATVLFTKHIKLDVKNPDWPDRDRFILSAGHASMLQYAVHYLLGYEDMSLEQIKNFRQLGAITAGHPEYGHADGIEATTGPLGQGITMAVGMALAEKLQNSRFGDELVDHYTWVMAGDGCLMEGISHEAIDMAGHLALGKLIVFWDDNSITIDGATDLSTATDQKKRFLAAGWQVISVDGHDQSAIHKAILAAKRKHTQPTLIALKTIIGKGSPNKAGTNKVHGAPLGAEEIAATRKALNWPYAAFEIPDAILNQWRKAGKKGAAKRQKWQKLLQSSVNGTEFEQSLHGQPSEILSEVIEQLKSKLVQEQPKQATRIASQKTLQVINPVTANTIGGSADLTGSNNTLTADMGIIAPDDFSGRYLYYGVREHAMAAVMNGLALHGGFIPYGGTFLVFAGYMLGAMRLSALMGLRVIYVLTHDSIGLGEDGPTHQPVETLASLRSLPDMYVYRPCDSVETAECWQAALEQNDAPSTLALTRQALPTLRQKPESQNLCARGAYVLHESKGSRDITLIATGSEVHLAVEAAQKLGEQGIQAAVVSMPCQEKFEQQSKEYREQILGTAPRIAVEAAVEFGWSRYTGSSENFVGMSGFGASAPAPDLFDHFGITAKAIVDKARSCLKV